MRSRITDSLLRTIELASTTDRVLLRLLFFVVIFSGVWYLYTLNEQNLSETPVQGGELREGIVGTPRFVNPVLANTRADQDMTALVYSGLMKIGPAGELVPDLAESVTIADDGLTYNIVLRQDIYFHNGDPVTTEDVLFTIRLVQDPDLKSPLRGNWADVLLEEISDNEFNIVLDEPYSPFIENFTLGILPADLWAALPVEQMPFSQLNTEPVGSGPFAVETAQRDQSGVITGYTLIADTNRSFTPNIETIEISFFENESEVISAFQNDLLDASAYISNERIAEVIEAEDLMLVSEPLPRIFAVFLNQNRNASLRDDAVREALSVAAPRDAIVENILYGQGVPMETPILIASSTVESEERSNDNSTSTITATDILADAGWRLNNQGFLEKQIDDATETLEITIRTSNAPLFAEISRSLERAWEALGVTVSIDQYEQADLLQSVIRPRDFEALLFGLDMSRARELYPFWHSSQQDDPGLNIAQYTNLTVDDLLETARETQDQAERMALLEEAAAIIASEQPAIFLFEPASAYVINENFILPEVNQISRPADRFANIEEWYTTSDELWNMFRQDHENNE